jgi:hypothetical protein
VDPIAAALAAARAESTRHLYSLVRGQWECWCDSAQANTRELQRPSQLALPLSEVGGRGHLLWHFQVHRESRILAGAAVQAAEPGYSLDSGVRNGPGRPRLAGLCLNRQQGEARRYRSPRDMTGRMLWPAARCSGQPDRVAQAAARPHLAASVIDDRSRQLIEAPEPEVLDGEYLEVGEAGCLTVAPQGRWAHDGPCPDARRARQAVG